MIEEIIAQNIIRRMAQKDLNITRLSELTGISFGTISSIINARNSIKLNTLDLIAEVLGCEVAELLDETSTMEVVVHEGGYEPTRAHESDAGYDLRSPVKVIIYPHSSAVIDTLVATKIPSGYVGFLKSKSGLNVKHNLLGEGVIDSGYTGTIRVKLYNHGEEKYIIEVGDKITQLVILPIITPKVKLVKQLEDTARGTGGFGSTGK